MQYLVLVTVLENSLESYLETWNKQIIPDVNIVSGPYITYQPIEDSQCIILIEAETLGKAEQFCKNLPYTKSIRLTPILNDKKALEEITKYNQVKKKPTMIIKIQISLNSVDSHVGAF